MNAWSQYLAHLRLQGGEFGRELSEEELLKLTPDQRLQLEKLKQSVKSPE